MLQEASWKSMSMIAVPAEQPLLPTSFSSYTCLRLVLTGREDRTKPGGLGLLFDAEDEEKKKK